VNFFRIAVSAVGGDQSVKNCTGFLRRIEKNEKTKWGGNNAQLTFAQGEEPDALSKVVRHPVPEYLDVLVVTSRNQIFPGTKSNTGIRSWPFVPGMDEIFSESGDYLLTIAITGDDVPTITALLNFTWTHNWQTAVLALIPESTLAPDNTSKRLTSESEETRKRAILTKVVDRIKYPTIRGKVDSIGALIELSDEFRDESDVVWVCKQLATHREYIDPFVALGLQYGLEAFDGKRLKFLRDARISRKPIMLDSDALSYLGYSSWAKNNGLRSRPYSPSPTFYPPNERPLPQSSKEQSLDSPEIANLKFKLTELLKKRERIRDIPNSSGFDMDAARARNERFIEEVRVEIQRLEKRQE
jgi:hypothetical protein